jgi:5-methylcytosine-specific restriction endonuclease McrA
MSMTRKQRIVNDMRQTFNKSPERFNAMKKAAKQAGFDLDAITREIIDGEYSAEQIEQRMNTIAPSYRCNICKNNTAYNNLEVDHIEPIQPISGFDSFDNIERRLFDENNLQVLCNHCSRKKTQNEKYLRDQYRDKK